MHGDCETQSRETMVGAITSTQRTGSSNCDVHSFLAIAAVLWPEKQKASSAAGLSSCARCEHSVAALELWISDGWASRASSGGV